MNTLITENLTCLRKMMMEYSISTYIITKFDPHQSEYSKDYWNGVKFISGFTGSNGAVVVTQDMAGLWTDGRYYLQAEKELKNSGIQLFKGSEPSTKDFLTFAFDETPENGVIGFDGRTLSLASATTLLKKVGSKNISLKTDIDILNFIWKDRPKISQNSVFEYDAKYCGQTRTEKLAIVKKQMLERNANVYIISSLDDIAWLLNIRCLSETSSFDFNAYVVITSNETCLFIDDYENETSKNTLSILQGSGIKIKKYADVYTYIQNLQSATKFKISILAPNKTNYLIYSQIKNMLIKKLDNDITSRLKSIKNNTEISHLKTANEKDAVAFVRLIKWIKEAVKVEKITEHDVSEKILALRKQMENFKGLSFSTISGYNENGAIIHYSSTKENAKTLRNEGFLLLDAGANYLDGTTDITRTISLGETTEKMKEYYTLVLKSHISLAKLKFLYGTTGTHIDIIARTPLWERGLNYQHGTGHGIGFFLNVHESPPNISSKSEFTILEEGMIMSNEPGIYIQNEFGIRLENTILAKKYDLTEHGQFMRFETISLVPFDIASIKSELLTSEELVWLNDYHKNVYEKLESYLQQDEKIWLKQATSSICSKLQTN